MLRHYAAAQWMCALALASGLEAQRKVDPRNTYERLLYVAPIVGTGAGIATARIPLHAPLASEMRPGSRTGILAYHFEESDDHKSALVEIVATSRSAFSVILADPTVKSFLKGRDRHEDAEAEFKKQKKSFDPQRFFVRVP